MTRTVKKPYSDVGSDVFFELHQGVNITGPAQVVMFDRAYDEAPVVLISSNLAETREIVEIPATNDRVTVTTASTPRLVDILVISGTGVVKTPFSDVTTDAFIETRKRVATGTGATVVTFSGRYKTAPVVITTPHTSHTHWVTAIDTESADARTGASSHVDILVLGGGRGIVKTPYSDVTSNVFFEAHVAEMTAGDPREVVIPFERTYKSVPAVFVVPSTSHSLGVTARTTSQCTVTSSAGVTTTAQAIVIGR